MDDWKKNRLASAVKGTNPTVLMRMKSGLAVLGDTQFLTGYCILIAYPEVGSLNEMTPARRADFLLAMTLLGDAVTAVCKPLKINYEILGNTDAYLHAHVFPRYDREPDERRKKPVWLYPREVWSLAEYQLSEDKHSELKRKLTEKLY